MSGTEDYALPDAVAAEQIFPVLMPPHTRSLNLQIFTGPAGGGGLAIYHVLPCNKIYTAEFPMPGKSWVLQYCTPAGANTDPPTPAGTPVLSFGEGLIAPDPTDKFDFKRPALPADIDGKLIVLRGAILKDGSVTQLTVISGVDPVADALAAAAFRRWKFHPALRSGKAIRVEILIGIPAASLNEPEAIHRQNPQTRVTTNRSELYLDPVGEPMRGTDLQPPRSKNETPAPHDSSKTIVPASLPSGEQEASNPLGSQLFPKGAIMLQIAAMRRESDARALAQALQKKNFPTFVLTPLTDKFYRVQVGPYPDVKSAATARRELQAYGFKPIVRQ